MVFFGGGEMNSRVDWVDNARGVGIVLVVFGHVLRGLNEAGLIANTQLFNAVDASIYLFHMPLFFLVSGLFFETSALRHGFFQSTVRRSETLIYPMILWSWITALFLVIAGSLTNRPPISGLEALLYPFPPKDIYWFLWALFVIQTFSSLFVRAKFTFTIFLFLTFFVLLLMFGKQPFPYLLQRAFENIPYFLLGVIFARSRRFPFSLGPWTGFANAFVFLLCLVWASLNPQLADSSISYAISVVATISFCLIVSEITKVAPVSLTRLFGFLGVASIAVYVSHVMPSAAMRIILVRLGVMSVPIHIVAGTLVGVFPGAFAYYLLKKWGYLRWFGLGRDEPKAKEVKASL